MDNIIHFNCRAFVCKRQDNAQLGPLKKATPLTYTALCRKTCKGADGVAWTKSLDTGYCYKATTTGSAAIGTNEYCSGSPGASYISTAKYAIVKSELQNAGNLHNLRNHILLFKSLSFSCVFCSEVCYSIC